MKIVLGVSGGIAAYKAPELVRRLQDAGRERRHRVASQSEDHRQNRLAVQSHLLEDAIEHG